MFSFVKAGSDIVTISEDVKKACMDDATLNSAVYGILQQVMIGSGASTDDERLQVVREGAGYRVQFKT